MKRISYSFWILIILSMVITGIGWTPVMAQEGSPTAEDTTTTEATDPPIPTDIPTATPSPFPRPLVVVTKYSGGGKKLTAGKTFDVNVTLKNKGSDYSSNVIVTFSSGDFISRGTGGTIAIGSLGPGESKTITQSLTAADSVTGKKVAYITASVSYTDGAGTAYSSDATLAFNIAGEAVTSGGGSYASATPTVSKRPQMVISGYRTDVDPLQPGTTFNLSLDVKNVGMATARNITMVLGGGSTTGGTGDSGTPAPGGVAGSSGEFTNFAPIGASNIQPLGNLDAGGAVNVGQKLIVNVTTAPGTYPVKFSYLYSDEHGNKYQDDQVITLLVYRLPLLEVNFYRPADPFMVGQMGILPIQVVNLSRNSTILGTMSVKSNAGQMMNNSLLVGTLDAGGYYPMDVSFTPDFPGPAEIIIQIQYTDDFNQPRMEEFKLSVEVADVPVMEIPPEQMPTVEMPETFWQKVVRFVKGIFGLDSAKPAAEPVIMEGQGFGGGGGGGGGAVVPVPGKP
jgi:hypothetical protein